MRRRCTVAKPVKLGTNGYMELVSPSQRGFYGFLAQITVIRWNSSIGRATVLYSVGWGFDSSFQLQAIVDSRSHLIVDKEFKQATGSGNNRCHAGKPRQKTIC